MRLTVRPARSFYEWSQCTGPDDPSEFKCAGLPTPLRKRANAGRRPSCPVPHCDTGSNTGKLGLEQTQGDASNSGEVAKPNPALGNFKSNPRAAALSSELGRTPFVRVGRRSSAARGLQTPLLPASTEAKTRALPTNPGKLSHNRLVGRAYAHVRAAPPGSAGLLVVQRLQAP
jgi:hypothetical protein